MRRILVFQHVPHEILGIFDPMLRDAGYRVRYLNFGRQPEAAVDVAGYHGLVVLGGPMNCDEVARYPHLATETAAIRAAIDLGIPVLGICLGAQLIARALGAEVTRNPVKEIGWYDVTPTPAGATDPLFRHFQGTRRIFQWHGDTFSLPPECTPLARTTTCAQQAFARGRRAWGLQFHPEFSTTHMRGYIRARQDALVHEGRNAKQLAHAVSAAPLARKILRRFVRHARR